MFVPSPLPRTLEASFRDLGSDRAATRVSSLRDLVRHAVRSDAVRTRAIAAFENVLRSDAASPVRAEAAVALADVSAEEALPTLLVAVEDEDGQVRQMALAALGEIGDRRAQARIERALLDERAEVRYQAVIAFARVARDDPQAVAVALRRALDDEDDAIRYIAMRVVEEHGTDGEPLRDPALVARAEELLGSSDATLAIVAALYLARQGNARGRAMVLDVVAGRSGTRDLEDEEACVELMGELGIEDAVPDLERRVWGRRRVLRQILSWGAGDRASCAWHARVALARMGHERARAEILAGLRSSRRATRDASVVAAGRAGLREARSTLESLGGSVDATLVREALLRLAVG